MRSMEDWLVSDETGESFRHCVACRVPLLELDASWLVNKDYSGGECVLEYAVCQPCRDRLSSAIPEHTKAAVRSFLETEIDWPRRLCEFLGESDGNRRFSHCIACREPRESLDGFAISALFDAEGHLVTGPLPLLMCRGCFTRMTSLLCDESRALWQRFLREHFDQPFGDDHLGIF